MVYLLHFSAPVGHAKHYTGFTTDLDKRIKRHRQGNGARLTAVLRQRGGTFVVARTWDEGREREQGFKKPEGQSGVRRGMTRYCPTCKGEKL